MSGLPAAKQPEAALASRADFPILTREIHGKPLIYLDSTATSQKPQAVIDAMDEYYRTIERQCASRRLHPERRSLSRL